MSCAVDKNENITKKKKKCYKANWAVKCNIFKGVRKILHTEQSNAKNKMSKFVFSFLYKLSTISPHTHTHRRRKRKFWEKYETIIWHIWASKTQMGENKWMLMVHFNKLYTFYLTP